VSVIEKFPPSVHNTTWTVDLCGALKKDKKIESKNQCPTGTYGTTPSCGGSDVLADWQCSVRHIN
jgi:Autophagy-related protein 27